MYGFSGAPFGHTRVGRSSLLAYTSADFAADVSDLEPAGGDLAGADCSIAVADFVAAIAGLLSVDGAAAAITAYANHCSTVSSGLANLHTGQYHQGLPHDSMSTKCVP